MNYTALGESVNLAARLEGLNKQLGTQILISESVLQAVGEDFATRPVDMVRPKGATRPVLVYELLQPGQYSADAESYMHSWARCYRHYTGRQWSDAIATLERHAGDFPEDEAAKLLLGRAQAYLQSPPPDDWDGVFVAKTK
jgi:adenylate cyclase